MNDNSKVGVALLAVAGIAGAAYLLTKKKQEQSGYGNIAGYVYEAGGSIALPGIRIFIQGTEYSTQTNVNGNFSMTVPVGNYTLVAHDSQGNYLDYYYYSVTVVDNGLTTLLIGMTPD